ncbi:MAG: hypothetical protein HY680_08965 [Chloroflexi bacterium]|nr:hypothetical protein [Chloroflexota bacterium]
MDPSYLTTDMWHDLSTVLRFLWLYVFLILGFVTTFLTAHAIIPSLAASGHLSEKIARLRAFVYLMAFGILAMAVASFLLMFINLDVVVRVWDRWWV